MSSRMSKTEAAIRRTRRRFVGEFNYCVESHSNVIIISLGRTDSIVCRFKVKKFLSFKFLHLKIFCFRKSLRRESVGHGRDGDHDDLAVGEARLGRNSRAVEKMVRSIRSAYPREGKHFLIFIF